MAREQPVLVLSLVSLVSRSVQVPHLIASVLFSLRIEVVKRSLSSCFIFTITKKFNFHSINQASERGEKDR